MNPVNVNLTANEFGHAYIGPLLVGIYNCVDLRAVNYISLCSGENGGKEGKRWQLLFDSEILFTYDTLAFAQEALASVRNNWVAAKGFAPQEKSSMRAGHPLPSVSRAREFSNNVQFLEEPTSDHSRG